MMKYSAVLFDMDGVILDSEPLHMAAFQSTLKNMGFSLSETDYKKYFAGKTDTEGFRQYFNSKGGLEAYDLESTMNEKAREYLQILSGRSFTYPGVIEIIKNLFDKVPLAVVTSSLRQETEAALRIAGIYDQFTTIITAEDVTNGKPDPEGYTRALKTLAVQPKKCVVVEDSPSGVAAAIAAGTHVIGITNTHLPEELSGADEVVSRLRQNLF